MSMSSIKYFSFILSANKICAIAFLNLTIFLISSTILVKFIEGDQLSGQSYESQHKQSFFLYFRTIFLSSLSVILNKSKYELPL